MLPESSVPNLEVIEDTSTVSVESPVGEVTENRVVTQALFENAREYFSPKYGGHNVEHSNIKFEWFKLWLFVYISEIFTGW